MVFSTLCVESAENMHAWQLSADFSVVLVDGESRVTDATVASWKELGLDVCLVDRGDWLTERREIKVTVPKGFLTDFGTTPRLFWFLCSPIDIAYASVIHDKMYSIVEDTTEPFFWKCLLRKQADLIFLMALDAQPHTPEWRKWMCWGLVRAFGWLYVNAPWLAAAKAAGVGKPHTD